MLDTNRAEAARATGPLEHGLPDGLSKPIHVVHLFGTLLPGGAERQALAIVRCADRSRIRFSAINCCAAENLLAGEFDAAGCQTYVIDKFSRRYLSFLWALRGKLRELQPDVVHTWLYAPGFWGRFAAITAGIRGIVASTRTGTTYSRWHEGFFDRRLSKRTYMRIVNSEGVRENLVRTVGLPRDRIRVIYNGVDENRLAASAPSAELRRRLAWPADAPVLLAVGRLVPEKNYPMLLRAIQGLRNRIPGIRAAIAGWGRLDATLATLRAELGLDDCVEFLGRREDVADLMHAADVFAMSSNSEGFSNALLEAMWVGLPVVSTRVNGAVEIVRDGENGFLVDVGDERAFEARAERLLRDAELRRRLGDGASHDVQQRFSMSAMVAAHMQVYEEAAANAARRL